MKKIIHIEIDEEITSIYDRIKKLKQKTIYLVVPQKAIIFQSVVNLKILKNKLKKLNKKLILITTDRTGRHLAEGVNIEVHRNIEFESKKAPKGSPRVNIQPIQARRNELIKDDTPRRFTKKKITIAELIKDFRMRSKGKKKDNNEILSSFNFVRPNRKLLVLIVIVSISLFVLISYIALPSATIYIHPKFNNIDHTINITLADKRKNQVLLRQNKTHVIASEDIITVIKQTKVFNTTSKEFQGVNATGKIKVINTSYEEWPLKVQTRFQTEEGIVFRTKEGVFVPPATKDEEENIANGELLVNIEADSFDIYGHPIGKRGNIPPARFFIPGLSKYNQQRIWGESAKNMTGGITKYSKIVLKEDIEAAKRQIEDNLVLIAKEDLYAHIKDMNKMNHSNLSLLDDRHYLKIKLVDFIIADDLEGSNKDQFEVFAKIRAQGVAYNFDQIFALLKKELHTRVHPNMRIREESINPDNISYEVISEDEDTGQIKITTTVKGIEEYIINPSQEAGLRFANKVKDKILGLNIEKAKNLINNFSEVDTVKIKTWPLWLDHMPRVPENIEIKLMKN